MFPLNQKFPFDDTRTHTSLNAKTATTATTTLIEIIHDWQGPSNDAQFALQLAI